MRTSRLIQIEMEEIIISRIDNSDYTSASYASKLISPIWLKVRENIWNNPSIELSSILVDELNNKSFDDHMKMVNMTHYEYYYSIRKATNIVEQDMDGIFKKYLSAIHLNHYQWFFNALDYQQIISIDGRNIQEMIGMVNRNNKNGHSIKKGCREKICDFTISMRQRSIKISAILESFQKPRSNHDYLINPFKLDKIISYMRQILEYPIPNKHCVRGVQLQDDIISILHYFVRLFIPQIKSISHLYTTGKFGKTIRKFFECTKLVRENPLFSSYNIETLKSLQTMMIDQIEYVYTQFSFHDISN